MISPFPAIESFAQRCRSAIHSHEAASQIAGKTDLQSEISKTKYLRFILFEIGLFA
jgi:hypothetical protein